MEQTIRTLVNEAVWHNDTILGIWLEEYEVHAADCLSRYNEVEWFVSTYEGHDVIEDGSTNYYGSGIYENTAIEWSLWIDEHGISLHYEAV